ncbi:MAG: transporter substrate-binding domain-containing protein [Propionibacteriaceae bacterium]
MNRIKTGCTALGLGLALTLGLVGCTSNSIGDAGDPAASQGSGNDGGIDLEKVTTFDEIEPYPEVQELLPERIKNEKVTISLSAAAPPTTFVSSDGKTSLGLNADITRALVRIMGIDAELTSVPFDTIIPGLASKKYQWSMASMSPTAERLEVLDMVTFTKGGTSIALPLGNPKDLTLDTLCGVRMAVGVGTIQATRQLPDLNKDQCESQGKEAIVPVEVPNPNQALLALSSGRVDAFMGDGVPLSYAQKANDGQFEILEEDSLNEGSSRDSALEVTLGAMAVPKDSDFTPALVEAMKVLQGLPQYKAIYDRWGMGDYALEADEVMQIDSAK